ncbi:hypothetical protein BC628DRAFT_1286903, partial [Trametes gibbosa]
FHAFPIKPTADTLSFFAMFMCHHIEPHSVDSYLSGICSELEAFYPGVRVARASALVSHTMKGFKRLRSKPIVRKRALTKDDLQRTVLSFGPIHSHDDQLFCATLLTGFHALLCLGELVWPDNLELQTYRKLSMHETVRIDADSFEYLLSTHKADVFFKGNHILVQRSTNLPDPHASFATYLKTRDTRFPFCTELWLRASGAMPTCAWFMKQLCAIFPRDIAGHSMRAGGATSLVAAGVSPTTIQ